MRRHVINGVLIVIIATVFAAFDHVREGAAQHLTVDLDAGGISGAVPITASTAPVYVPPDAGHPATLDMKVTGAAYLRVECSAAPDPAAKLQAYPYMRAQDIHSGAHLRCYRSDGVSW